MNSTWHKEGSGWFANDYGSVMQEHDGWWWYPRNEAPAGPYGTKRAAMQYAEEEIEHIKLLPSVH